MLVKPLGWSRENNLPQKSFVTWAMEQNNCCVIVVASSFQTYLPDGVQYLLQ
jgi:hypothetical protein